jgi:hypothetical protein
MIDAITAPKATIAVRYQFGVRAPELLRDVAIPARRAVGAKDLGDCFRFELAPLVRNAGRIHDARLPLHPLLLAQLLAADDANLAGIPAGHKRPDEASVFVLLDLPEALLAAVALLGPARAVA